MKLAGLTVQVARASVSKQCHEMKLQGRKRIKERDALSRNQRQSRGKKKKGEKLILKLIQSQVRPKQVTLCMDYKGWAGLDRAWRTSEVKTPTTNVLKGSILRSLVM